VLFVVGVWLHFAEAPSSSHLVTGPQRGETGPARHFTHHQNPADLVLLHGLTIPLSTVTLHESQLPKTTPNRTAVKPPAPAMSSRTVTPSTTLSTVTDHRPGSGGSDPRCSPARRCTLPGRTTELLACVLGSAVPPRGCS